MTRKQVSKGFTLIELLIVIAIILILIAIALPNFLEAQIRARVVNAEGEMRTVATALESYQTDWRTYPCDEVCVDRTVVPRPPITKRALVALSALTTPIAYLTEVTTNPFPNRTDAQPDGEAYFRYFSEDWIEVVRQPGWKEKHRWSLASSGPDLESNVGEYLIFGQMILESIAGRPPLFGNGSEYSPTNGTKSAGDLVRVGP